MPPIWNISHWITSDRPFGSVGIRRARILGEVNEDRAGLEHREVTGIAIDDGGMRPFRVKS